MKALNENVISGMQNGWESAIVIRIKSTPEIWICDKAIQLEISGEAMDVISDILPSQIDDKKIDFISNISVEIKIENGIYFQPTSAFDLFLISRAGINISVNDQLTGSEISIFMIFIDPNKQVFHESDLLLFQKAHINRVDQSVSCMIRLNCIIGDVLINDKVPSKTLNKTEYPCLPKSSTGKCIPLLYGKFISTDEGREEYDLAPAVKIDDFENRYAASSHEVADTLNRYFIYCPAIERYAEILSDIEFINLNGAWLRHDFILYCEGAFRLKQRGSQMSPSVIERYLNFIASDTINLPLNSQEALYLSSDKIDDPGYLDYYYEPYGFGNLKVFIEVGNVINGQNGIAAKIKYYLNGNFYYYDGNCLSTADSNTIKELLFDIPEDGFFKNLKKIEIGIEVEASASVEFKNMFVKIKFLRK